MMYTTYTLPCGLQIIHEPSRSPVVYCGYVVKAGTRHEDLLDTGMAHFLEHMSFKGTTHRRACHILNGLERVGGDLNAFTTKQETVYSATVLREDFARAADLLTDIVFCSTYPQNEIQREVEVICDEIDSYKDSPSELIFDEFEALMYPNQPLGRDILGDADRLRQYNTVDAMRFARRYYCPSNAVFYVYGDLAPEKVHATMSRLLAAVPRRGSDVSVNAAFPAPVPRSEGVVQVVDRGTHQAHVLMGAPAFGGTDPRRFALLLLNNVLGGPGMNARLNVALREKAGLVYAVDSYLNTYPDTGFWNVYFGCDIADVSRCLKMVHRELDKLIDKPMTPSQLAAAKKQLRGQIGISVDASESYATAMGKTFAHYGVHRHIEGIVESLSEVTAIQVQEVAHEVFHPARLTTLIYR